MGNTFRNALRRRFAHAFWRGLVITWPILSVLLGLQLGLGVTVGIIEEWGIWKGLYFACITGMTIGYGDLVPTRHTTQLFAVGIGACGILLTGLMVALAVHALQRAASPGPLRPPK